MTKLYATFMSFVSNLDYKVREEKGATAVEYGLLVALIAAVIIAAVTLLGGNIRDMFNDVAGKVGVTGGSES